MFDIKLKKSAPNRKLSGYFVFRNHKDCKILQSSVFCLLLLKKILQNFMLSNEEKLTSNEQKVASNEQKLTSNQQKVMKNGQKLTSNDQRLTSYEQKLASNE